MKLQEAIGDRQHTADRITISTERFKALYTIVQAIKRNDNELLAKALKNLKATEARDFVHGVDQS